MKIGKEGQKIGKICCFGGINFLLYLYLTANIWPVYLMQPSVIMKLYQVQLYELHKGSVLWFTSKIIFLYKIIWRFQADKISLIFCFLVHQVSAIIQNWVQNISLKTTHWFIHHYSTYKHRKLMVKGVLTKK